MKTRYTLILAISIVLTIALFLVRSIKHKGDDAKKFVLVNDSYNPKYSSAKLVEHLEKAYTSGSKEDIELFFEEWYSSIPPNPPAIENQHPLVKDVYDIYRALFTTENEELAKRQNQQYLAVQNDIGFLIEELITFEDSTTAISFTEHEIFDFRPSMSIEDKKILYLTDEYKEAVLSFLNCDPDSKSKTLGHPYRDDIELRHRFLNQYIRIELVEGVNWVIESPPRASGFYFESNHTDSLRIGYQIYYYGYDAIMTRTEKGWELTDRKVSSVI